MSEREPYDTNLVDAWLVCDEPVCKNDLVLVHRFARMAYSEHTARLEAEARVERLEAFVEKIESWVLDEAVGFEEDSSGYARAAYDVSHMLSRASLETGGEG